MEADQFRKQEVQGLGFWWTSDSGNLGQILANRWTNQSTQFSWSTDPKPVPTYWLTG